MLVLSLYTKHTSCAFNNAAACCTTLCTVTVLMVSTALCMYKYSIHIPICILAYVTQIGLLLYISHRVQQRLSMPIIHIRCTHIRWQSVHVMDLNFQLAPHILAYAMLTSTCQPHSAIDMALPKHSTCCQDFHSSLLPFSRAVPLALCQPITLGLTGLHPLGIASGQQVETHSSSHILANSSSS